MKVNYILHEREDLIRMVPVYKIGKTADLVKRKRGYPKGSEFLFVKKSKHMKLVEDHALILFKTLFKHRLDRGREYFEGDFNSMERFMNVLIEHYNTAVNEQDIIEIEKNAKENDAASIIQKYWKKYNIKKIKACVVIQKQYRKYVFNKENFKVQTFIDNNICKRNDNFLKLRDVKKLWNSGIKNKMKDDEIIVRFCKFLGLISIEKSNLGWQNKDFKTCKEKKNDETKKNDPVYKVIHDNFIITRNDDDYISYKDIENLVKDKGLFSTPKDLGIRLESYGFSKAEKKINKQTVRLRQGIRNKINE